MDCIAAHFGCATTDKPYALYDTLPLPSPRSPQVERFTAEDAGSWRFEEYITVLQKGMQGGDNTPPDGNMDWLLNEKHRRGKHLEPLGAGPSDVRKKLFRFCMSWSSNQALEFGGCFGIRDPESQEMMCAALCFPPNEQKLYEVGTCKFLQLVYHMTMTGRSIPEEVSKHRMEIGQKTMDRMHEKHAPGKHWYLLCLSTVPLHQQKGYGTIMLQFINKLADADHVPVYLETAGPINEAWFHRHGYKTVEFAPLVDGNDVFDEHGGMCAMRRDPLGISVEDDK